MEEEKKEHKCSPAGINESIIYTETRFGHGDSSHVCYVKCSICNKSSRPFGNYGLFEPSSLREAQRDFNILHANG
jgi:hypothetical protein